MLCMKMGIAGTGLAVMRWTVWESITLTSLMSRVLRRFGDLVAGSFILSIEYLTALASRSSPFSNFIPSLILTSQIVSAISFQDLARPLYDLRCTRGVIHVS